MKVLPEMKKGPENEKTVLEVTRFTGFGNSGFRFRFIIFQPIKMLQFCQLSVYFKNNQQSDCHQHQHQCNVRESELPAIGIESYLSIDMKVDAIL